MKILFASTGGSGHFTPLIPWIDQSLRSGHEVLVVGPPGIASMVVPNGFPLRLGASPPSDEVGKIWAQVATMKHDDAGSLVVGEIFCRLNSGALLPAVRATCEEWMPDLVFRDPSEFASAVAAEERHIRHVRVGHGLASGEAGSVDMAATSLQAFGRGLDKAIFESTYLTLFPEVLDQSPFMDTRRYRLATGQPAAGGLPDWWPGNSNPLVYATFGTVAPGMPQMVALCRAVLNAVAGLPVRVLMTVGREFDFAQLGVPPGNVRIERWVDQDEVLAHAALVICHGGAGTTLGALSAGVPVVAFPLFADQAANAACVAVAGAGIMISAGGVAAAHRKIERDDSALIRTAVLAVLDSAEYVRASTGIRAAFHNLPTLAETYDVILEEQFSASR